jgi:hypothetical protein
MIIHKGLLPLKTVAVNAAKTASACDRANPRFPTRPAATVMVAEGSDGPEIPLGPGLARVSYGASVARLRIN